MKITTAQGDTLSGLAGKWLGDPNRWKEIQGYTGDPTKLQIGTELTIPSESYTQNNQSNPVTPAPGTPQTETPGVANVPGSYIKTDPKTGAVGFIDPFTGNYVAKPEGMSMEQLQASVAKMVAKVKGTQPVATPGGGGEGGAGAGETPVVEKKTTNIANLTGQVKEELKNQQPSNVPVTGDTTGITTSDQFRREQMATKVKEELGAETGTRPELPDYEGDFEALRSQYGLQSLEDRINKINQDERDMEAALRQGLYDEEGKLRPMELITGRQRELTRQAQEAMDELTRRKQTLVDEYNTKVGVVNTIMNLKQMDYEAAKEDYNTKFSQALNIENLIENRLTREDQIANQASDLAGANLTVIMNGMAESGTTWEQLNPSMQAQISKLELQRGLPMGIVQSFMSQNKGLSVDYVSSSYDAGGNQIVSFFSYNKGNPILLKSLATGGKDTSSGGGLAKGAYGLTNVQLDLLASVGVPENVAITIQKNIQSGTGLDEVQKGLTTDLGNDSALASNYVDRFNQVINEDKIPQFIDDTWIKSSYSQEALTGNYREAHYDTGTGSWDDVAKKEAKAAGFGKWYQGANKEVDNWLKSENFYSGQLQSIQSYIDQQRKSGLNDLEIAKALS